MKESKTEASLTGSFPWEQALPITLLSFATSYRSKWKQRLLGIMLALILSELHTLRFLWALHLSYYRWLISSVQMLLILPPCANFFTRVISNLSITLHNIHIIQIRILSLKDLSNLSKVGTQVQLILQRYQGSKIQWKINTCLLSHVWLFATYRLYPTWLLCSWDSPRNDTGVGCHALLQGIFPTQGSNLSLLRYRWIVNLPSQLRSSKVTINNINFILLFLLLLSQTSNWFTKFQRIKIIIVIK